MVAVLLSGACGFSFPGNIPDLAPHTETWEVLSAIQAGGNLTLKIRDPKKDLVSTTQSDCLNLVYGGNLASCLVRCTDKQNKAAVLAEEPDYESVWRASRSQMLTGDPTMATAEADLEIRTGWFGSRKKLKVKTRRQRPESLCRLNDAKLPFDGLTCVNEISGRVTGLDPVGAYQVVAKEALTEVRKASLAGLIVDSVAGNEIVSKLERMLAGLGELRELLEANGISGFQRTGIFLVKNITNSPALICQLRSQSVGVGGASNVLRAKIDENIAEIERSTDFLNRLGLSPQEDNFM